MTDWLKPSEYVESGIRNMPKPVRTGIGPIDEATGGGFRPGPHVIAAPPGIGKTSLSVALMAEQLRMGHVACYVSNEIVSEEIFNRLAANLSGGAFEWSKVERYAEAFYERGPGGDGYLEARDALLRMADVSQRYGGRMLLAGPRATSDVPGPRTSEEVNAAIGEARENGASMAFLDYLQLIDVGERFQTDTDRVKACMDVVTTAATEHQMPVVVVASQSRMGMNGQTGGLTSVSGSARVEYSALTLITISEDKDAAINPVSQGRGRERAYVIEIHKNRYGSLLRGDEAIHARCVPSTGVWIF